MWLIDGLENYFREWIRSGFLDYMVIDGSFVALKPEPGDIDIILIPKEAALSSSSFRDVALRLSYDRDFTKDEFGCEGFIATKEANLAGWMEFFGTDRQGRMRGLLKLTFLP